MEIDPLQEPRRPKGFFESVLMRWRETAMRAELTDKELVVLAAKFLGLSIAGMQGIPPDSQVDVMSAAVGIVHSAWDGRTRIKQGAAWPLQHALPPGGVRR